MSNFEAFPTAVFCIIATEFCERFSFCGLRTILSIYLRNELMFSENASTVIYHIFIMVCYIVPIVGAVCADSVMGRYRVFSSIGLLLISVGTGGIKPCVAAFGGDQFRLPIQQDLLQHFFSIFYFTLNFGGFVGMIITPILRKWISCFGDDTCYSLGFGFPAALMVLAILLLVVGKSWYKLRTPKENIILQFTQCALYALSHKKKQKKKTNKHWLNAAKGRYSLKLIRDMKTVLAVIFLYVPLPIFWSLFDQQGSRWTFQASHMNGNVMGIQIVPDQMQVVNPAIVLILIPIFDKLINPYMSNYRMLQNPLHRMAIGGVFASSAFLMAGILELILETTYPKQPNLKHASIYIVNTLPCDITFYNPFNGIQNISDGEIYKFNNIACNNFTKYTVIMSAEIKCKNLYFRKNSQKSTIYAHEQQTSTVLIGINTLNNIENYITDPVDFQKSLSGKPRLRINYIKDSINFHNVSVSLKNQDGLEDIYYIQNWQKSFLATSAYMELPTGLYECKIFNSETSVLYKGTFYLAFGGVYSLVIREQNMTIGFVKMYTMSNPNTINILWLLPQYFLISLAEILFGVSGLEFSFTQARLSLYIVRLISHFIFWSRMQDWETEPWQSFLSIRGQKRNLQFQAPKSMKTITIAVWYLSVAVGNLIVIVITQANLFESQAQEFFLFAVIMIADMIIFIQIASGYKFVQLEADSSTSCMVKK